MSYSIERMIDFELDIKPAAFGPLPFLFLVGLFGATSSLRADPIDVNPPYLHIQSDPTWSQVGSTNEWRVTDAAYDYNNELFELPVEGDKWTKSGGFLSTTFKYYEYLDMKEAKWGADASFLYFFWETSGSRIYDTQFKSHGYLGHYYAYFGVPGKGDLVIEIPGGKADILGSTFADVSGDLKVLEDTNSDVPGPGGDVSAITTTSQGGDGFDSEISGADLQARRNGNVVEVAVDLTSVGLTLSDVAGLEYMYIGVAESNPSSVAQLFSNDHFAENFPTNTVEYDNVLLAVPEPSAILLFTLGAVCLVGYLVFFRIPIRVASGSGEHFLTKETLR